MLQITAPHFVAGYDTETGNIAPIIKYMEGWGLDEISEYCSIKQWELLVMQIKIVEVNLESVKKGKTGYQVAHVSYTYNGEPRTQKIMSFANPAIFKEVQELSPGETIDVTLAKDSAGYTQWAKIVRGGNTSNSSGSTGASNRSYSGQTGRDFETADERKLKQLLIVRQSSISNALEYMKATGNNTFGVTDLLDIAQHFVDFVYDNNETLENMKDDIPF